MKMSPVYEIIIVNVLILKQNLWAKTIVIYETQNSHVQR